MTTQPITSQFIDDALDAAFRTVGLQENKPILSNETLDRIALDRIKSWREDCAHDAKNCRHVEDRTNNAMRVSAIDVILGYFGEPTA